MSVVSPEIKRKGMLYLAHLVDDLPSWAFLLYDHDMFNLGMLEDFKVNIVFSEKLSERLQEEVTCFVCDWVEENPFWAFGVDKQVSN